MVRVLLHAPRPRCCKRSYCSPFAPLKKVDVELLEEAPPLRDISVAARLCEQRSSVRDERLAD